MHMQGDAQVEKQDIMLDCCLESMLVCQLCLSAEQDVQAARTLLRKGSFSGLRDTVRSVTLGTLQSSEVQPTQRTMLKIPYRTGRQHSKGDHA